MQKKRGISLIVLVITIIVMIILAAAIIITLNNSGIIGKSNKAVQDTNEQEVNHIASLAWSEAYLNGARTEEELTSAVNNSLTNNGIDPSKYLITVTKKGVTVKDKSKVWVQDGLNITKGNVTLEAGDLIQYDAGVEGYTGAWQVLGAEDGNLLILSTDHVGDWFFFYGFDGGLYTGLATAYRNKTGYGLMSNILQDKCDPYGIGTGAVGVRSIKIEDINKLTGYDPTKDESNNDYGIIVNYTWDGVIPEEDQSGNKHWHYTFTKSNGDTGNCFTNSKTGNFEYVDFNAKTHTSISPGSDIPSIKLNYYQYNASTLLDQKSTKAKQMLVQDYRYWLDSLTCNFTADNRISYGLRVLSANGNINYEEIAGCFHGYDFARGSGTYVRAVVKLSPNITIGEKDATLGWSYTI